MAWVATDNDGRCFVYYERPQKCFGGYAHKSGRARLSEDSAIAEILGIPFPKPGEMIEWPSPAQVAAAPESTTIEKTCVTCKWDHRRDSHGLEKIAFCIPCREHSNWEPREGVAETGKKFDEGKLRYDLIPVEALREVVRVLTFGAKKYGDNNWKITKPESRYTAAAMRHGEAYRGGEVHDPESGVHHLAHRICCDLFLLQIDLEKEAGK